MPRLTGIAIEGGKIRPPPGERGARAWERCLARSIASPGERAIHLKTALAARASTHSSDVDTPIGNGRDGKRGPRSRLILVHATDLAAAAVVELCQRAGGEGVKRSGRGTHRLPSRFNRPDDAIRRAIG